MAKIRNAEKLREANDKQCMDKKRHAPPNKNYTTMLYNRFIFHGDTYLQAPVVVTNTNTDEIRAGY